MPNFKEYRFVINGKIDGVEMTPMTIPMARLAEYITELAALLGYKESVHFLKVEEGSTAPVMYIDETEVARVVHRVQAAKNGRGPKEANAACEKLRNLLRRDDGNAELVEWSHKAKVIEFPKEEIPVTYGPIREHASIIGRVMRVGGFGDTIPVHLQRADGRPFYCDADDAISSKIALLYHKYIRVHGIASWTRDENGKWNLERFKIQSYDPDPLSDESVMSTIERLRAIPDNGWADIDDPLEELRRIRRGEDKPQ